MQKQLGNSISTPLMVCNGASSMHKHHKSKDTFIPTNPKFGKPIKLKILNPIRTYILKR